MIGFKDDMRTLTKTAEMLQERFSDKISYKIACQELTIEVCPADLINLCNILKNNDIFLIFRVDGGTGFAYEKPGGWKPFLPSA